MKKTLGSSIQAFIMIVPLALMFVMTSCFFFPAPALAGSLEPSGSPSDSSTRMYTTQQIYDLVGAGKEPVLASSFTSPSSGPGSTMRTLNEICDLLKSKFSSCTAVAGDVLSSKYFFATEITSGGTGAWGATRGTIPDRGNGGTVTPGTSDQTIAYGYWRSNHTVLGDADLLAANIKYGVDIFGVAGTAPVPTGDAAAADVLIGKTFSNASATSIPGAMANNGAGGTITPGTIDQTIAAGYWSSANTVSGDADLVSTNIRSTVNIFGVAGDANVINTTTGSAPAAGDMLTGKTAFANGAAINGSAAAGANVTGADGSISFTIPDGLYSDSKTATAVDGDLAAANIRSGINIFGYTGPVTVQDISAADAEEGQVMSGKTFFSTTGGIKTGSLATVSLSADSNAYPAGNHAGDPLGLSHIDSDLVADNIKDTVTIFGVLGTYSGGGGGGILPKTCQQPGYPAGAPFVSTNGGDDAYNADPAGNDVGGPQGTGSWAAYNSARFTAGAGGEAGTVTDNATGLMWEQKTDDSTIHDKDNTYTWANAFSTFIAALNTANFAGHADWRMPNRFELESILDLGRSSPPINPIFKAAPYYTQSDGYWSSTTFADGTDVAWVVGFYYGRVLLDYKANAYYVRAVRGGE